MSDQEWLDYQEHRAPEEDQRPWPEERRETSNTVKTRENAAAYYQLRLENYREGSGR